MMLLTGSKKESTLNFYERAGYKEENPTGRKCELLWWRRCFELQFHRFFGTVSFTGIVNNSNSFAYYRYCTHFIAKK